jgi:hypothetical protein
VKAARAVAIAAVALVVAAAVDLALRPAPAVAGPYVGLAQLRPDFFEGQAVSPGGAVLSGATLTLTGTATANKFVSSATSTNIAFQQVLGAKHCLDGASCNAYLLKEDAEFVALYSVGARVGRWSGIDGRTTTTYLYESTNTTGNTAFKSTADGARWQYGTGASSYWAGDGTTATTPGYSMGFQKTFAGAPTSTDCNADIQRGRMTIDTTNFRLYICNGATRGWDYVTLTD